MLYAVEVHRIQPGAVPELSPQQGLGKGLFHRICSIPPSWVLERTGGGPLSMVWGSDLHRVMAPTPGLLCSTRVRVRVRVRASEFCVQKARQQEGHGCVSGSGRAERGTYGQRGCQKGCQSHMLCLWIGMALCILLIVVTMQAPGPTRDSFTVYFPFHFHALHHL